MEIGNKKRVKKNSRRKIRLFRLKDLNIYNYCTREPYSFNVNRH